MKLYKSAISTNDLIDFVIANLNLDSEVSLDDIHEAIEQQENLVEDILKNKYGSDYLSKLNNEEYDEYEDIQEVCNKYNFFLLQISHDDIVAVDCLHNTDVAVSIIYELI